MFLIIKLQKPISIFLLGLAFSPYFLYIIIIATRVIIRFNTIVYYTCSVWWVILPCIPSINYKFTLLCLTLNDICCCKMFEIKNKSTHCNRPDCDTSDMANRLTINTAQFYRLNLGTSIRPVPAHTLAQTPGTIWPTADEWYRLSFDLDRPNASANLSLVCTNGCPDRWSARPGTLPSDCWSAPRRSTAAFVDRPTTVWTVSSDVRISPAA